MITIRSTDGLSEPALISFEATLTTQGRTFTFSSNGPMVDPMSPFGGGLFGAMSWPRSCFQLTGNLLVEHQMFLAHDGSGAALSWELCGGFVPTTLVVRPFFAGCSPRSYRDTGFQYESEQDGGLLAWLPNVRGPKFIADTNGQYQDEPLRSLGSPMEQDATAENLIAPGTFTFELNNHPSILIFSSQGRAEIPRSQYVGQFLASLTPSGHRQKSNFVVPGPETRNAASLVEAA